MTEDQLITAIDAILPQTQCGQCGFPGCRPYATALADGRADINQCPPGGEGGILRLAMLLGKSPKPLNTTHGITKRRTVAFVNEQACIGCTLCIAACPVDAIVGAAKQAHTVMAGECTGCELCLPPCPMDCIAMIAPEIPAALQDVRATIMTARGYLTNEDERKAADRARARHQFRLERLERDRQEQENLLARKAESGKFQNNSPDSLDRKKAVVQAALERAMATRARHTGSDR